MLWLVRDSVQNQLEHQMNTRRLALQIRKQRVRSQQENYREARSLDRRDQHAHRWVLFAAKRI